MAVNPPLRVDWLECVTVDGTETRCACGARYRDFRLPEAPRDSRRRFRWAKRQLTRS